MKLVKIMVVLVGLIFGANFVFAADCTSGQSGDVGKSKKLKAQKVEVEVEKTTEKQPVKVQPAE